MTALISLTLSALAASTTQHFDKITDSMIAVYTPMKEPSSVGLVAELDLSIIPAYAQFLRARNITNVLPAGSNGESLSLSVAERKSLAEAWAAAAKPLGLKVYMHVGSESLSESIELAQHSAKTDGITGIIAMAPVYFKPTVETLVDFLAAIAGGAPTLPFWFYHFPDDTNVLPGQAHAFLELADSSGKIPNLMGIKFTDYNLMDFQLCMEVGAGKYNMLYGRDEQALGALLLGADAAVSSTIGYSPTLRNAVQLWKAGKQPEAIEQQTRNAKLCSFFGTYESQAMNVQKNIMAMVGMPVGPSRLPKTDIDAAAAAKLESQLRALSLLDEKAA